MRIRALDGLRGAAAYFVLVTHYAGQTGVFHGLLLSTGQTGVMVFFVLSGYLMGLHYMQTPISYEAILEFYIKRVARVVPMYLVVVVACWLVLRETGAPWLWFEVTNQNLWSHLSFQEGWGALWTIPVEMQFYAIMPVFWLVYRHAGQVALLIMLVVCAVAIWVGREPISLLSGYAIVYFVAGLIISTIRLEYKPLVEPLFIILCALVLLTGMEIEVNLGFPPTHYWSSPVFMIFVPLLVLTATTSKLAGALFGTPAMTFAGRISYSVYLLHMPVYVLVRLLFGHLFVTPPPYSLELTALVATTIAATATFYLFETPMRRWISSFAPRVIPIEGQNPSVPNQELTNSAVGRGG